MAAGVKINTFNLPTLTPGLWDIQVSYTTPFGYFYPQNDTIVNIAAGKTTTTKVKIPYQVPAIGIVKGIVDRRLRSRGRPARSSRRAPRRRWPGSAPARWTPIQPRTGPTSCSLSPGTWWIQGVTYVYSGFTTGDAHVTHTAGDGGGRDADQGELHRHRTVGSGPGSEPAGPVTGPVGEPGPVPPLHRPVRVVRVAVPPGREHHGGSVRGRLVPVRAVLPRRDRSDPYGRAATGHVLDRGRHRGCGRSGRLRGDRVGRDRRRNRWGRGHLGRRRPPARPGGGTGRPG